MQMWKNFIKIYFSLHLILVNRINTMTMYYYFTIKIILPNLLIFIKLRSTKSYRDLVLFNFIKLFFYIVLPFLLSLSIYLLILYFVTYTYNDSLLCYKFFFSLLCIFDNKSCRLLPVITILLIPISLN